MALSSIPFKTKGFIFPLILLLQGAVLLQAQYSPACKQLCDDFLFFTDDHQTLLKPRLGVDCDNIRANPDLRAKCTQACGKCKECKNGVYACEKAKEPSTAGCEQLCANSMGENVDCNKLTEDCEKKDCKDECGLCLGCKDGKFECQKLVTPAGCDNVCEKYKKYRFEDDSGRSIVDCGDLSDPVMISVCKADCAKCKDCAPTGGRFDCGEHESIKEEKKQKEQKAKEEVLRGGLGGGSVLGIVVMVLLFLGFLLVGGLLYFCLCRKQKGAPRGN